MAKGSWTAIAVSSKIVPYNYNREKLMIQMHSGDIAALGFGENAEYGVGMMLMTPGHIAIIQGALAREAVYAICDTGNSASGGYQEDLGIT